MLQVLQLEGLSCEVFLQEKSRSGRGPATAPFVLSFLSQDFEDFVTQLDEIMVLKSKCIQSLRNQLHLYLACHRLSEAPERTVVS